MCFSLPVEAACCVPRTALLPDENTFLVSPLSEAEASGHGEVMEFLDDTRLQTV